MVEGLTMDAGPTNMAIRLARLVQVLLGAKIGLFFLNILLLSGTLSVGSMGTISIVAGLAFLVAFIGVPLSAAVWLIVFGTLNSAGDRLRFLTLFMITTIFVWILIIASFVMIAFAMKGQLNVFG